MSDTIRDLANDWVLSRASGKILIYPSWANFSRKWQDLPTLFLSPETWGPDYDLKRLRELGYDVDGRDHQFFDGPNEGGLIQITREPRRWLPRVLFHGEASFYSPPGFPRVGASPILAIIPQVSSQHRILGDKPIPRAPSPHVSVEKLPTGIKECVVALGVSKPDGFKDDEFRAGFPSLRVTLERLKGPPEDVRSVFAKVDDPRLTWFWYLVNQRDLKPCLWIAAVTYLGFRLADITRNNVRDMLIFSSEFTSDAEFPSAQLWTSRKTKGIIRTVDDW